MSHLTPTQMAWFFAWGCLGAVVASAFREGRLQLPRVTVEREADGHSRTFIDPGFFGIAAAGGLLAMIVDHRPEVSLTCGVTVAYVGRDVFKPLVARALKQFQLNVSFGLPEVPPADPSQKAVNP